MRDAKNGKSGFVCEDGRTMPWLDLKSDDCLDLTTVLATLVEQWLQDAINREGELSTTA